MERIDTWLLQRIFTPIAHFVDRWLHVNNYRLAAWMMWTCACFMLLDRVFYRIAIGDAVMQMALAMVLSILPALLGITLTRCGRDFETRPGILPAGAAHIQPGVGRLFMLILDLAFVPSDIAMAFGHFGWTWAMVWFVVRQPLIFFAAGLYFATVPRPKNPRFSYQMTYSAVPQGAGA